VNSSILLKVYCTLFGILLCSLPFSDIATSIPNIILFFLFILFPFCFQKEDIRDFRNPTVYIYVILIVYVTLNIGVYNELGSEMSQLSKLYLPLFLYLLSIPLKKSFKHLKVVFVIGVFCAVAISLISILFFILEQGAFDFTVGKKINEVLILERVYIAFMCVLSFVFSLDLIRHYKKLMLINISVLTLFVLLIAARMALITIVVIAVLYMLKTLDRKKIILILGTGSLVLISFFLLNKNLQNRFFYKDHKNSFIKSLTIWEPRMVIWPCAYDIITKEDFGVFNGLASYELVQEKLVNCYDEKIDHPEKRAWFLFIKFNTHNQFLDFLLVSGIIGLFLFLCFFIISLWKYNNFLSLSLLVSFLLLGFVENYLHRQVGAYCFGIFLVFLFQNNSKTLNKRRNNE